MLMSKASTILKIIAVYIKDEIMYIWFIVNLMGFGK